MDYQALFNELHLFEQLLALLVGMPRLFMLVQVAPFMGGNILTGQLRTTVVFACYLILHPAIVASLPEARDRHRSRKRSDARRLQTIEGDV